MERLTIRNDNGMAFWKDLLCAGLGYRMTDDKKDQERLDRLAAYEDTGMTPEEIKSLATNHKAAIADIYHIGGCPNCKKNLGRHDRTGLPVCADNREYPDGSCFVWRGHTPNDLLAL